MTRTTEMESELKTRYGFGGLQKVFTTGEVAKLMRLAPRTVNKIFDSGKLKGYRIPGSMDRRIPRENLIAFLKAAGMPLGDLEEEELHKVLLIGTEKLFSDRIKELLPDADAFKYEWAGSGFQAGCLLRSFGPDYVVIDLSLGRGESSLLAMGLRKIDDLVGRTLIIGLAGEDEADPDKLKGYGFDEVYQKPFDAALLAERVRQHAGDRS